MWVSSQAVTGTTIITGITVTMVTGGRADTGLGTMGITVMDTADMLTMIMPEVATIETVATDQTTTGETAISIATVRKEPGLSIPSISKPGLRLAEPVNPGKPNTSLQTGTGFKKLPDKAKSVVSS